MTPPEVIEVPVHYLAVRVRRIGPFHWALLRALQVFAPGARPALAELSIRLRIGEPVFLQEAWRDLLGWHAVDDTSFLQATLTLEGEAALREGCVPLGPAVECTRVLRFSREGAWLPPAERAATASARPLTVRPSWSSTISSTQAEHVLRAQVPAAGARPDERWQAVRLAWPDAVTVTAVDPPARDGR